MHVAPRSARTARVAGAALAAVIAAVAGTASPAAARTAGAAHAAGAARSASGAAWSRAQDPRYRPQEVTSWPDGGVYTVVATSAANAWALGSTDLGQRLLIRHWDGSTWSQGSASYGELPAAGSLNEVVGSAATSAGDIWGVGLTGAGRRGPPCTGTGAPGARSRCPRWAASTPGWPRWPR
jgi:hypothetical protein